MPIVDRPSNSTSARPRDASARTDKGTYAFISLGCPKNLVDSERMLGLLQLDGYRLVSEPDGADLVVVNTCGFIEQARQESYGAIREMLELKRRGGTRGVIVSGCLAEREKEALLEQCPEIDFLIGVFGRESVTKVADRLIGGLHEQRSVFQPAPSSPLPDRSRLRITPRHFAYLKISEGCDRLCTFCAIPKMRGKHATKPIEEVLDEARELVADGVRELNVVAQDTTYYGLDLYGRPRLAELLAELDKIDGLDWIRKETTGNDVAMVFLAGHGVNDQNNYYFFYPHNIDPDRVLRTGLAFSDIKNAVSAIAGKALFFVDTCHSGNSLGLAVRRGSLDINIVINELSSAQNGVVVFSASTGSESSYERPDWNNGAFTKALVEGLTGAAAMGTTGRITYNMLNVYVSERVKELTRGQQHPTMISPQTVPDFPIAVKK